MGGDWSSDVCSSVLRSFVWMQQLFNSPLKDSFCCAVALFFVLPQRFSAFVELLVDFFFFFFYFFFKPQMLRPAAGASYSALLLSLLPAFALFIHYCVCTPLLCNHCCCTHLYKSGRLTHEAGNGQQPHDARRYSGKPLLVNVRLHIGC